MLDKNGFLIINKVKDCTSHDCVREVRKLFNIKKVGHTGTLDPQVTGVLVIALGHATRFIQYLSKEKTYIGTIKLGLTTSTDDIHGEILNKLDWPKLTTKDLEKYLSLFRGNIQQVPPKVSSVHIEGVRAYKKAFRKEEFVLKAREVSVNKLILKKWDKENGKIDFLINCSSGTYIRSIARDLGKALNSEGCLYKLNRTESSGFLIDQSFTIAELKQTTKNLNTFLEPTKNALVHLPQLILHTDEELLSWKTGRKIKFNPENYLSELITEEQQPIKIINNNGELLGIGFYNSELEGFIQPKLVLNAK